MARYIPHPKQLKFHTDPAKIRFFGGAMGWWKSKADRMEAVRIAKSAPNLTGAIFRRTYEEVSSSIIRPLLEELTVGTYKYNKSEHVMTFPNGSIILFRHANHPDDVYKYQWSEFDFLWIDELQHWTYDMFSFIKTRVRTSKPYVRPCIFGSGNPWGLGHAWIKRLFVDREFENNEKPEDYSFTFSNVYDNPTWQETDPDYIALLESLDPVSRRAYLEGDWNVFKGQYFGEWKPSLHICQPFQIPDTWEKIICLDYGLTNPTSILWIARDPSSHVFYVYRQVRSTWWLYHEVVDQIIHQTPGNEWAGIRYILADPALSAKSPTTRESFFEIAKMRGLRIIPANNDRLPGWQIVRRTLAELEVPTPLGARSRLQVFSTCSSLIKTLPGLQFDSHRMEDLDTNWDDHDADALRYWLNSAFGSLERILSGYDSAGTVNLLNTPIKEDIKEKRMIDRIHDDEEDEEGSGFLQMDI